MKPLTPLGTNQFPKKQALRSSGIQTTNTKPKKEIKPSDVYDMKIKTSKLEQDVRLLKTQLSRTKDRINQHNKTIGKTIAKGGQTSINKGKGTLVNLGQSIETATNTVDFLNEKLRISETDDKNSLLLELHEEILISHAEYMRVKDELKDKTEKNKKYEQLFSQADARASSQYIDEQEKALRNVQDENASLIEKIQAYQNKKQKIKIEQLICKREEEGESLECSIQEVNDANERHAKKLANYKELAKEEDRAYTNAINDLSSKIMYQRQIIADFLKGNELPPPGQIPEPEVIPEEQAKEKEDDQKDEKTEEQVQKEEPAAKNEEEKTEDNVDDAVNDNANDKETIDENNNNEEIIDQDEEAVDVVDEA